MSETRLAVIGVGLIGQRHARLIHKLPEFELVAVIDPSPNTPKLAGDLQVPYFESLGDFLRTEIECEGLVIATPNETHRSYALQCFDHGVPCLIEKPLAANSEDASVIAHASTKSGVPVLVGHHRRHHAVSRKLKEKIDAGELGQLVGAQLTWMLRKPDAYFTAGPWRTQKGGGPVWINLIHEIDLLRYFLGEIVEVTALFSNNVRGNTVEDTGVINMRCENGVLISAILSDCAPSPWHFEGGTGENPNIAITGEGGLRIFGAEASIEFPSLTVWQHETNDGDWGSPIMQISPETQQNSGDEAALTAQLNNFAAIIHATDEPLVSVYDGLQSVRVVEAIHHSAENGGAVTIPTG